MKITDKYTFFYKTREVFSQWHPSRFEVDGIDYCCAEQFMMHQKALMFGDSDIAKKIMNASSPGDHKAFGRMVSNFDSKKWDDKVKEIVHKGNYAKFTQNKPMLDQLLATRGTVLVEASPFDKIWGIGLSEDDADALDPKKWKGTNWLGEVLTKLRDDIIGNPIKIVSTPLPPGSEATDHSEPAWPGVNVLPEKPTKNKKTK